MAMPVFFDLDFSISVFIFRLNEKGSLEYYLANYFLEETVSLAHFSPFFHTTALVESQYKLSRISLWMKIRYFHYVLSLSDRLICHTKWKRTKIVLNKKKRKRNKTDSKCYEVNAISWLKHQLYHFINWIYAICIQTC